MALIRWFDDSDNLSQMERHMEQMQRDMGSLWSFFRPFSSTAQVGVFPPMNIYDDGESYIARAELPGVDPNDIDITITGDTLNIRGKREIKQLSGASSYHRRERKSGEFKRAFNLPDKVDSSKVSAGCKHGILEIRLPRAEESKQRKIEIKTS